MAGLEGVGAHRDGSGGLVGLEELERLVRGRGRVKVRARGRGRGRGRG